jgi:hypothetical protein
MNRSSFVNNGLALKGINVHVNNLLYVEYQSQPA